MRIDSIEFVGLIFVFLILYLLSTSKWFRQFLLAGTSFIFLASYINSGTMVTVLPLILVIGYVSAWYAKQVQRVTITILALIGAQVILFVLFKRYDIILPLIQNTPFDHVPFIVGYSYILFRQIHVIVDCAQGTIPKLTPISYTVYLLNFLTLLAGPIQRYQAFLVQWDATGDFKTDFPTTLNGLSRIANGYFAFVVLAFVLRYILDLLMQQPTIGIIGFYTEPIILYLNFAGYCSVVIGIGQIIGFELPENFDRPWLARDPLVFWRRWHITLADWMRDYVFTPLYKLGIQNFPRHGDLFAIGVSFFTFWVVGLWHGTTFNYVIVSVILAVAAAATQLYDIVLKKRMGRKHFKRFHNQPWVVALSIFVTLHYFSLIVAYFE